MSDFVFWRTPDVARLKRQHKQIVEQDKELELRRAENRRLERLVITLTIAQTIIMTAAIYYWLH